ncbi:MAG: polysaccharide biosynthesis protein [Proteobacteria bacterium]|nr:polysaccharide biosynthesis protein [Pseudomonadota bacterium]
MPLIHINTLFIILSDMVLLACALAASYCLRFNFSLSNEILNQFIHLAPSMILIKIVIFYYFNLYRGMWRYTSTRDLINIVKACLFSSMLVPVILLFTSNLENFPRSVFIMDACLTVIFISGTRISIRLFYELGGSSQKYFFKSLMGMARKKVPGTKSLIIIGAGGTGEKILREIRDNANLTYHVVGFLDDNPVKINKMIHGIPVLGNVSQLSVIAKNIEIEEILIAIPSATAEEMRTIISHCKNTTIPFKTLPSMGELIDGKITVNAIRDVAYRDLLGREVIQLDQESIGSYLKNGTILVTGAGGSIGSELCRQICRFRPETLILFERAESPLYDIELELRSSFPSIQIIPVLGSVQDKKQLEPVFSHYHPGVVFHAAAYKHVPMLEIQPWKAITNNVLGTRNLVEVSSEFNVNRFVLVSTDKAVRPTNIMGASKRICELLVGAQSLVPQNRTRFMIVRFGNVAGSVGSVIPLFKKQIEQGGPVTVTHPEITRYFMTIPEASQLILQAGSMGTGGEIFILEMGKPIKIVDIAKDIIRLSGFAPDVDIAIKFIGLRPGEKLYEELITEGEGIVPTSHEKILVLRGNGCNKDFLNQHIDDLLALSQGRNISEIQSAVKEIVPEYQPQGKVCNNGV